MDRLIGPGQGTSNKKWRGGEGGQNVKGTKFFKHYTLGCANSQKLILLGVLISKNYTAPYTIFIHKGLH